MRSPRVRLAVSAMLAGALALTLASPDVAFMGRAKAAPAQAAQARDPLAWPFAQDSIWNMPIGSEAVYADATVEPATAAGVTSDEDVIIMAPDAPTVDVLTHDAGWDRERKRCESVLDPPQTLIEDAPIPGDFFTDPGYKGLTPNMGAAILMPDGRTVVQSQPFHRCADGRAVSQYRFPDVDLYGQGIEGAHGGSGMSALGGAIRVGELAPGSVIRHALKMNLWGKENLHCSADEADGMAGYRWPAVKTDTGACDPDHGNGYGDTDPGMQMGTLLALRPDFDVASLRTEPARIIAQALKDYGAYIVDNTGWDVFAFETEWGPAGRVTDEVAGDYGISFDAPRTGQNQATADFQADIDQIMAAMHYVDNNTPESVGGGGDPRAPLAPPLDPPQ